MGPYIGNHGFKEDLCVLWTKQKKYPFFLTPYSFHELTLSNMIMLFNQTQYIYFVSKRNQNKLHQRAVRFLVGLMLQAIYFFSVS